MADIPSDIPVTQKKDDTVKAGAVTSPWEDEVEVPEPKEKIVGTMTGSNIPADQAKPAAQSFLVPKDVDKNVGPTTVTPQNFPNAIANASPKDQVAAATPNTTPNSATGDSNLFTFGNDFSAKPIGDSPPPPPPPPQDKVINNDIKQMPAAAAPTNPPVASPEVKPLPTEKIALAPDLPINQSAENTAAPANPAQPSTPDLPAKKSIFSFFNRSGAKEKTIESPLQSAEPMPKPNPLPVHTPNLLILGMIIGILALAASAIFLTEQGWLSIGLENIYGATGVQNIWGGLSSKTESALTRSFVAANQHPNFKIKGTIDMTIDKSVESPITTPLVSYDNSAKAIYFALDKAMLAVSDITETTSDSFLDSSDSTITDSTVDSTGLFDTSTSDSALSNSNYSSASTTSDSTASSSDAVDQETQSPYESVTTTIKDLSADFTGFIGDSGNSVNFNIQKPTGTSTVELKNQGSKLWVKSDSIKFDQNATPTRWLEYQLSTLSDKSVSSQFFSIKSANGFSATGNRTGNEKVGETRCYKYNIDDLNVGSSLSAFGIKSEQIQSISGTAWLGVRDKLPRKLDLKIAMSTSSPVTLIKISIEFYDYDSLNNAEQVFATDIIIPGQTSTAVTNTETSTSDTTTNTSSVALTGDAKRKSNLASIKTALELYKENYSSYPTAPVTIKLNVSGNIIERLLTPGYIPTLPKDEKDTEGWYYGYKSVDGKSYSLTARLESTSDTEGKLTGGIYLYFLYNE